MSLSLSVAYPSSQVSYRWHNPTLAVGYEGELQLSQFDIINTKYRQVNFSRDATGENCFKCVQCTVANQVAYIWIF